MGDALQLVMIGANLEDHFNWEDPMWGGVQPDLEVGFQPIHPEPIQQHQSEVLIETD